MGRNGVVLFIGESSFRRRLLRRINADGEFLVVTRTDDLETARTALADRRVGFAVVDLAHASAMALLAAAQAQRVQVLVLARSSAASAICGALFAGARGCLLEKDA